MSFLYSISIFLFLFMCFFLCVAVLIQEGKGGGLGASFGGGEGSDSLFGTATPDILKKVTAWLAIAFVAACILLSFWTSSLSRNHVSLLPQDTTEIVQ
jgi:preprotein translocase subunit SecG